MLLITQLLGHKFPGLFSAASDRSGRAPVVLWHMGAERGLSPVEAAALVDDLAAFGSPALIFVSEGAPLREDLLPLMQRARRQGLATALATSGRPSMRQAGLRLADTGTALVMVDAAADGARAYLEECRSAGIPVGVRQDLTSPEALSAAFTLAQTSGSATCVLHHTVQTAGAPHSKVRHLMDEIYHRGREASMEVVTDGNRADGAYMYLRLRQDEPDRAAALRTAIFEAERPPFRVAVAHVEPDGAVSPDERWLWGTVGSVRNRLFSQIWTDPENPLLRGLRHRRLLVQGRCRECGFLPICDGNLRARAGVTFDDPWAEDPACYLTDDEIAPDRE